jgi:hypothetical protein
MPKLTSFTQRVCFSFLVCKPYHLYLPDMNYLIRIFSFLTIIFVMGLASAKAQDTLPNFTVQKKGNGRVVISWANPYPNLIQLAVQRSYDSLKRFGTVYSTTSPELPVNGFSDKVIEGVRVYYRIFYVMEGGTYYFTQSKQPGESEDMQVTQIDLRREALDEDLKALAEAKTKSALEKELGNPDKVLFYRIGDSTDYRIVLMKNFRNFRDSIINQTKDTLFQLAEDTLLIKLYDPPYAEKMSQYVFTDKDGYIVIKLDDAEKKKYQVTILEENETPLIEIKQVKDPYLILDKTNFYKGGWYKFVIKENGRVKEKGKVYLPKDFRP